MEVLFDDYRIEYFIFVTRIHKNARPKTRSHKSINKITWKTGRVKVATMMIELKLQSRFV